MAAVISKWRMKLPCLSGEAEVGTFFFFSEVGTNELVGTCKPEVPPRHDAVTKSGGSWWRWASENFKKKKKTCMTTSGQALLLQSWLQLFFPLLTFCVYISMDINLYVKICQILPVRQTLILNDKIILELKFFKQILILDTF